MHGSSSQLGRVPWSPPGFAFVTLCPRASAVPWQRETLPFPEEALAGVEFESQIQILGAL